MIVAFIYAIHMKEINILVLFLRNFMMFIKNINLIFQKACYYLFNEFSCQKQI